MCSGRGLCPAAKQDPQTLQERRELGGVCMGVHVCASMHGCACKESSHSSLKRDLVFVSSSFSESRMFS